MADVTNFTDTVNMLGLERDLIKVNQRRFTFWKKREQMSSTLKVILEDLKAIALDQDLANFYCKGPDIKCFSFVGYRVSVSTNQCCHCSMKAAISNN